jgi:glycosyltransferase involved in cell wall biosynthesis
VLTVIEDEKVFRIRDYSLLNELNEFSPETKIIRTNLIDPYENIFHRFIMGTRTKFSEEKSIITGKKSVLKARSKIGNFVNGMLIPDRFVGWLPYAIREGVKIVSKYRPRVIFSSSPPETNHVIALYLTRKYNIPWIADFRDPWTQYYFSRNRLYPFMKLEKYIEKKVLEKANNVIATTEECKNSFISLYPWLNEQKFHVIPNGYDEDDFMKIKPKKFDKFTIIFTGNLYQQTPPDGIFNALNFALNKMPKMRKKCQFLFIGKQYASFPALIKKWELENIVKAVTYQEHHECLAYLLGSDVCYYNFSSEKLPTEMPLHHSAKLYEYLRSGNFIFAVIPENLPVAKTICEAEAGVVIEPDNVIRMRKVLLSLFEVYIKSEKIPKRTSEITGIKAFERKNHTHKLANLLNNLYEK